MNRFLITISVLLISQISMAQVNMTKYASDDLFKVEPIIIKEALSEADDEEEFQSFFQEEINEGLELWNSDELDDAVEHFRVMTESYPETSILYYYLGGALLDKKSYDEAIAAYEDALKIDPLFLDAKFMIGLTLIENDELSQAKDIMETLTEVPVYAAHGYYGLGVVEMSEKSINPYRARKMYGKCLKVDSTFKEAYIPLTYIELSLSGNIRPSLRRMNRAVAVDSTWQQARIIRAMLAVYADNNLDQFERDIDILILQDPLNYHFHSIKAYLNYELKEYRHAVQNFTKALNLEIGKTSKGAYQFSTKIQRSKSLQAGLNYYQENIEQIDTVIQRQLDMAICEFMNNNSKQAELHFRTAVNKESNSVTEMFMGILLQQRWNKELDAIAAYDRAILADSTNFMAYSFRGDLLVGQNKLNEAFQDFSTMIALKRTSKDGYKKRASVYYSTANYINAYRDYSTALVVDTTDTDLYFNRASCAFYSKYFDQSISDLKKVVQRRPKDGEAYNMLHLNYLHKTDTIQSIAYLDSASKYSRYTLRLHKKLLKLAKAHDIKPCIENAHDRLVKYGHNSNYRLQRAKYFYDRKRYDEALLDLRLFLKRKKDSGEGYYYLGQTLVAKGEMKPADKALNKAAKLGYKD